MRDFEVWFAGLRDSIATYDYYVDFPKVIANAQAHKTELYLLSALIGARDVETEFRRLITKYPSALEAIPILLAKREAEIYARDGEGGGRYHFRPGAHSLEAYCLFMRKTGLFDLLANHLTGNLYDYVMGVEVGLDSNGRKNRGGHLMEDAVEGFLRRANVAYAREVKSSDILGPNLASLTNAGKTIKRFDFTVTTPTCLYAIETNFYASSGSKLNETARSYKLLAIEARNVEHFRFVWVTDGLGWRDAKANLRETFDVLPTLYSLKDLEDKAFERLFR